MRDLRKNSDWWRSWLWVLAGCAGFALTALQPSVTVSGGPEGSLASAVGPAAEMAQDRAAVLDWLADEGHLPGNEVEAPGADDAEASSWEDLVERILDERSLDTAPTVPTTVPDEPTTTTTVVQPVTPTVPPSTTTTTTTAAPPSTTVAPSTTTTAAPPTTTVPQGSMAQAEQRFVDLINQERAAEGTEPLVVDVEIRAVARAWTGEMIDTGRGCRGGGLSHNPSYGKQMPDGWKTAGENVGCGQSVGSLHEAFMDSSGHRKHILDEDFTHVGVGVEVADDGTMWVTQDFGQY